VNLYLVRHGQTEWNLSQLAQGHTDVHLDEVGLEQAALVGMAFESSTVQKVLTSDLQRARRTAEQIACSANANLVTLPELRERSFGDMEGAPYAEIRKGFQALEALGEDPLAIRLGGGESAYDVWDRVKRVTQILEESTYDTVVVTHGGTCGILLAQLLKGNPESSRSFVFGNTSITQLERKPTGVWSLVRYNDTSHLASPGAPMVDTDNALPSKQI